MTFQWQQANGIALDVTNWSAVVRESGAPTAAAPQTILKTDQAWTVHVHFEVSGPAAPFPHGTWHLECYLESIGAGGEFEIPEVDIAMGAWVYDVPMPVAAGAVVPEMAPGEPSTPFKITTTLTAVDPAGTVWPMAGYEEGPIIQFFV